MLGQLRALTRHLSYANIVATLALFLALGGVSYAVLRIPKASVGTAQLRNGAVTAGKLARGAVTSSKLARGTVTSSKLAPGAVTASSVAPEALTGAQINAATLGVVPSADHAGSASRADSAASSDSAANAAAVGGVPLSGLLQSNHVLTGSASVLAGETNLVFQDPRTGVQISANQSGDLVLANPSATATIAGYGIGYYGAGVQLHATSISLAPGAQQVIAYDATSFTYGHFVLVSQPSLVALDLTCTEAQSTDSVYHLSCVGVG
jgi:hypothetical protein